MIWMFDYFLWIKEKWCQKPRYRFNHHHAQSPLFFFQPAIQAEHNNYAKSEPAKGRLAKDWSQPSASLSKTFKGRQTPPKLRGWQYTGFCWLPLNHQMPRAGEVDLGSIRQKIIITLCLWQHHAQKKSNPTHTKKTDLNDLLSEYATNNCTHWTQLSKTVPV